MIQSSDDCLPPQPTPSKVAQVVQAAHTSPPFCQDSLTLFFCPIYLGHNQYKQWFFMVLAGAN